MSDQTLRDACNELCAAVDNQAPAETIQYRAQHVADLAASAIRFAAMREAKRERGANDA